MRNSTTIYDQQRLSDSNPISGPQQMPAGRETDSVDVGPVGGVVVFNL